MKKILNLLTFALIAFGMSGLTVSNPARAEMKTGRVSYMKNGMHITRPWANPTTAGEKTAAVFMKLHNHRRDGDVLVKVKTPVAEKAVIHKVVDKGDGKHVMEPATNGLAIARHERVHMELGGVHIMLMGLKEPLKNGAEIPMTLVFEKSGPLDIMVSIAKPKTTPKAMKKMEGDIKDTGHHHH